MRTSHTRRSAGFTLIELLVVISIIAVLVALTSAAVQRVRDVGKRTQVVAEIQQLDTKLNEFMSKMGVKEIASRGNTTVFTLRSNYAGNENTREYRYLKQLFPSAALSSNDDGWTGPDNGLPNGVTLNAGQILTFWLGGYYFDTTTGQQTWNQGFVADARFPFRGTTAAAKKNALYDFPNPGSRLVDAANRPYSDPASAGPYYFMDPWGTPYCFFSTEDGRDNNYFSGSFFNYNSSRIIPLLTKPLSAAAPNTPGVFANPKTFQIFSAGKDRKFAFGTAATGPALWQAGTTTQFLETSDGGDDFSNFNSGSMMSIQK